MYIGTRPTGAHPTDHSGQQVQRTIEFEDGRETKIERCRRILSGDLIGKVKPAAELSFTDRAAHDASQRARATR